MVVVLLEELKRAFRAGVNVFGGPAADGLQA
jgi:hypothetical protein